MSVSCVIVPMVVASWPTLAPALVAAAGALGFRKSESTGHSESPLRVQATVPVKNAEVVADELTAGESMEVVRDDVRVRFALDSRGRCQVHVSGEGRSKAELQKIGTTMANKVVQMVTYHKLVNEAREQGFDVVMEEVDEQGSIRVRLRR